MTDRQLQYMITLSEEGNMTTAARKLFISQPSLSALLNHVEQEVGAELFNRNTTPLSLTAAGKCYIEMAHQILSLKREMENHICDIANTKKSSLHIGCGTQLSAVLYPKILPCFMRDYPDVTLHLVEDSFLNLCTQLHKGDLDLVVANRSVPQQTIDSLPLYREELSLVVPEDITFDALSDDQHLFPVIHPEELSRHPFILVKKGQNLRKCIDDFFHQYHISPEIILETNNWDTCYQMVSQHMGFTIVPYTPVYNSLPQEHIRRYSLPGRQFREIRIFWSKKSYISTTMQHFIHLAQSIF